MNSRRFIVANVAVLCALAACVLSAQAASAAENTGYTCLSGGSGFANGDCWSAGSGFHDEAIPNGTNTQITAKTIATESEWKLASTIVGSPLEIVATGVECMECMAENKVSGTGEMEVFGSGGTREGTVLFTGVHIPMMSGCTVRGKVTGTAENEKVETTPLKLESKGQETKKVVISAVNIEHILAEFEIIHTGAKCTITGSYAVSGDVVGTSEGAILNVNQAVGTTLKLGSANAGLIGKATIEAGITNGGLGDHHPALLT
jgi:hypothetical protein